MPAHFRALLTSAALLAGSLTGAAAAALALAPAASAAAVPPAPAGWTTVFSDDFAGAAGTAPSAQNWFYDIGTGYGTGETEQTTSSTGNVYVDGNGHLVLKAVDSGGTWTSARIESTRDDFQAPAGGELEMTASIEQPNPANGLGYWPAFWALGSPMRTGGGWPTSGEIDMMEDVNGLNEASQTLHDAAGSSGHALMSCPDTSSSCQSGYHTYSVILNRQNTSAETLEFLMDGTVESTITEASVGTTAWQEAVDHGFFIIFDLAMGGNYPNGVYGSTTPTSATTSGAAMSVGYVAVYEEGGNSTPTGTATATGALTGINGLCAADQGALNTEGNPMVLAACDGDPGEQWSPYSDGTVRVQGGCLDVVSAGTTSGTDVDWYPCNASNAQNWTYESNGELVNPNSGLCLTDPGGNTGSRLDIETCADTAQQQWKLPTGTSTGGGSGTMTVTASQYAAQNSTGTEATSDTGGGNDVGWINSASWLEYTNVDFGSGYSGVEVRDASAVTGTAIGSIQFRLDSETATPFATVNVNGTGGWQTWVTSADTASSPTPTGTHTLYVTFTTSTGGNFVNVNWFEFTGGSTSAASPVTVTASQYAAQNSTGTEATSDTGGGNDVGWINSASWLEYTNVDFGSGLSGNVAARIASAATGTNIGTVQFRLDSLTATPFATVNVSGTGGWQTWVTATGTASPIPSGTHTLYVTFTTSTTGNFVNVNWFKFS
ncbi:carbohydrate-binding protein [Actinospica sp. MGRD01-02]|uniref:Carbohydrate-binding protein n=1 Tax=Actinospica acidithermotolerans TaxID=2828514 RepID=A0A941EC31_9ACTN|nr:carbohydrate-binding protein [Actinospica acidithermotolerans]MBR7828726.1 carbohydrate-binding protein [Actinospica acidithermotolerans]